MHRERLTAAIVLAFIAARGTALEHQPVNSEKLGEVHFATSCNEPAQSDFDRAVALLHSFQFDSAIDGFNAVLRKDPACGIAYWGVALSDWGNPFAPGQKDVGQLQLGQQSSDQVIGNAQACSGVGAISSDAQGGAAALSVIVRGSARCTAQRARRSNSEVPWRTADGMCALRHAWKTRDQGSAGGLGKVQEQAPPKRTLMVVSKSLSSTSPHAHLLLKYRFRVDDVATTH